MINTVRAEAFLQRIYRLILPLLVVQFKESEPAFYNAYRTARVIVDQPRGRLAENASHATASSASGNGGALPKAA
jgi:hypothetical protein